MNDALEKIKGITKKECHFSVTDTGLNLLCLNCADQTKRYRRTFSTVYFVVAPG